jgi:D-glycero-alpha-D-manno-heptose-7-phosphate kinase
MAAAIHALRDLSPSASDLAEWSRAVEVEEMRIAGGRQDHYAAAFGGALGLSFGASVDVERIVLSSAARSALEQRCLLVYSGESRISGVTITAVLDGYRDRAGHVLRALDQMGTLARQMRDALVAGDIDGLAALVDEHWRHQRTLHPAITTERIDAIEHAARRVGALGLKALGASGGGCMIVFASDSDVDRVARSISPLAEILPWQVDDIGVRVHEGDSLAG